MVPYRQGVRLGVPKVLIRHPQERISSNIFLFFARMLQPTLSNVDPSGHRTVRVETDNRTFKLRELRPRGMQSARGRFVGTQSLQPIEQNKKPTENDRKPVCVISAATLAWTPCYYFAHAANSLKRKP